MSANTYLGLETLHTYDINLCAEYCNNKTLGTDFNVVAERDPCLNLSDTCTQPASSTEYKCTLRGSGVDTASATNCGCYRGQAQTAIASSDGFEKTNTNTNTPAQRPGGQATQQCGGDGSKGHDHPNTCISISFFPGPYNPAFCAAYADAKNTMNQKPPFWGKWIVILL